MNGAPANFGLPPETYDLLVDWPRRLAAQTPLFRRLFAVVGARRVLDAACGTGRHAALFHSWGLEVEGADVNPAMIAHARELHGESATLRWAVRSFTEAPNPPAAYDAVICVGNSLALAPDRPAALQGVRSMLAALRPGGVGLVQVLNLWRITEGPLVWMRCVAPAQGSVPQPATEAPAGPMAGGERVLVQTVHRIGDRGYLSFADLSVAAGQIRQRFDAAMLVGLTAETLDEAVRSAGGRAEFFGGFDESRYDPATSQDLLLVLHRD